MPEPLDAVPEGLGGSGLLINQDEQAPSGSGAGASGGVNDLASAFQQLQELMGMSGQEKATDRQTASQPGSLFNPPNIDAAEMNQEKIDPALRALFEPEPDEEQEPTQVPVENAPAPETISKEAPVSVTPSTEKPAEVPPKESEPTSDDWYKHLWGSDKNQKTDETASILAEYEAQLKALGGMTLAEQKEAGMRQRIQSLMDEGMTEETARLVVNSEHLQKEMSELKQRQQWKESYEKEADAFRKAVPPAYMQMIEPFLPQITEFARDAHLSFRWAHNQIIGDHFPELFAKMHQNIAASQRQAQQQMLLQQENAAKRPVINGGSAPSKPAARLTPLEKAILPKLGINIDDFRRYASTL